MASEIRFKHRNIEEANRFDYSRIGIGLAGSDDGLEVIVEPQIDGFDSVDRSVAKDILQSALNSAGIYPEITIGDAH